MLNELKLEIAGFGRINEAEISIGKINVVGGVNASGKSTASKLLYCFLKARSLNRKEYLLETYLPMINEFINVMAQPDPFGKNELPDRFTADDDFKEILKEYSDAKKKFKRLGDYFEIKEYFDDMEWEIDRVMLILMGRHENDYSPIVKSLFKDESLLSFEGRSNFYNDSFKCSVLYEPSDDCMDMGEIFLDLKSKNLSFDDYDGDFIYLTDGDCDFLNEVFYIDTISTFDLDYYINKNDKIKKGFRYKEHVENLLKTLKDEKYNMNLSDDVKRDIEEVNGKISNIIGGHLYRTIDDFVSLNLDYYFIPDGSDKRFNVNISSGIQQISILQVLLDKYKLYPGCFLIIDEPEVNLHPTWQFKFAEILVLLSKELNITIYLNSHSPMFIEAIDAFAEFHDMEEDINFYLTEKSEIEGKYNFTEIKSNELYRLYKNLGDGYKLINRLRIRKRLNK